MSDVRNCAVCKDLFDSKNENHVVCDNPDCKKKWYKRDKGQDEPVHSQKTPVFTDVMRQLIVECLEFRKIPLSIKRIAKEVYSTEEAVKEEIERMKSTGEYEQIRQTVRRQRGKV